MNYEQLIASLANQNPPPKIVGEVPEQQSLFVKEYDWKEQDRVLKAIQNVVDHAVDAWPALINHLDDKAYCITFEHEQSVWNHSIGDICYIILLENMTAAYMPHIPAEETAFLLLRHPDIIPRDDSKFKLWCREQHKKGRTLYELQVEMCQWALKEIPKLKQVTEQEKYESFQNIQKEIERLRTTKKPTLIKTVILREIRAPYSQRRADEIRATLEKEKERVQKTKEK
jgi:hypothetical protein